MRKRSERERCTETILENGVFIGVLFNIKYKERETIKQSLSLLKSWQKHHRFVRIGDIFSVTCYVPGILCILSHLACRFLVFHTMRADNFGLADLMKSCLHKVLQTCCQPSVIVYVLTCGLLNRMFLSPSGLWLVFTVAFKFYWLTQNVNLLNVHWIIEQTGKRLLQDEVAPGNDETAAEMWKSN